MGVDKRGCYHQAAAAVDRQPLLPDARDPSGRDSDFSDTRPGRRNAGCSGSLKGRFSEVFLMLL